MVPEKFREGLQFLMQPFVDHIRPVLEPAGDKIHVDVRVFSVQHVQKVQVKDRYLDWRRDSGIPHHHDLDEVYIPIYSELLEIAWPWTRVPWRYTLKTLVDQKISSIRDEIFQRCDANADKNGLMVLNDLRLKSDQSWTILEGRRILKDRMGIRLVRPVNARSVDMSASVLKRADT
ncbi:hypothetical protein H072_3117 [Dactylellina haptotyla CBS 200.50]|uniref:Uncharacterized protein n=1 Tax=Dactylellina haptotyla (strain CBS 200.50) TaxID=1284197 RepID=S8C5C6_DACHA|nr:hypothetical protein H072_3117 [Dactylellina haptotyla CBS 200.50]